MEQRPPVSPAARPKRIVGKLPDTKLGGYASATVLPAPHDDSATQAHHANLDIDYSSVLPGLDCPWQWIAVVMTRDRWQTLPRARLCHPFSCDLCPVSVDVDTLRGYAHTVHIGPPSAERLRSERGYRPGDESPGV
jgi:hypothetical protein